MARSGSGDSFDIGLWPTSEDPGSGTQDFGDFTDKGLNGNWKRLWRAIKTVLSATGAMNSDVVDGPNIKNTAYDQTTIGTSGSPKKAGVLVEAIDKTRIKDDVADGVTLRRNTTSKQLEIAPQGVKANALLGSGSGKVVDGVTIHINANGELELMDDAVTATKQAHGNKRTRFNLTFGSPPLTSSAYFYHQGVQCSASLGVPMTNPGSITAVSVADGAGVLTEGSVSYGTKVFAKGDFLKVWCNPVTGYVDVYKSSTILWELTAYPAPTGSIIVTLEIELDD